MRYKSYRDVYKRQDFIQLDEKHYQALKNSKKYNFRVIYQNSKISDVYDKTIEPMFEEIYNKLLYDLKNDIKSSPIFKHHIELIDYSNRFSGYEYTKNSDFNDIVTDYIASMTDDYFIDLYEYLFNKQAPVKYISCLLYTSSIDYLVGYDERRIIKNEIGRTKDIELNKAEIDLIQSYRNLSYQGKEHLKTTMEMYKSYFANDTVHITKSRDNIIKDDIVATEKKIQKITKKEV